MPEETSQPPEQTLPALPEEPSKEQLPALSDRQIRFAFWVLRTGSATKAYRMVSNLKPLPEDATKDEKAHRAKREYANGAKMMDAKGVREFIKAERDRMFKAERMAAEEIVARLARIGRADPRRLFNDDGSYKTVPELDEADAAIIRGWEDQLSFSQDGAPPELTRKIRIADPVPALTVLARIENLLDKTSIQVNLFGELDVRSDRARKRALERRRQEREDRKRVVSEQ